MKKYIRFSLVVLVICIASAGCKKNNDVTPVPATPGAVSSMLTSGTWEISSFTQKAEDKTGDFSGLNFTFSDDSKLTVSGNGNVTGLWLYTPPSAGYYGSSTGGFSIDLGTGSPFGRLSRAWKILSQTNTVLKLDAAEATEDEHVIFSKK